MNMPSMGDLSHMATNPSDILNSLEGKLHYPANKDEIVNAINKIPDIPQPAKEAVESKLPEGNYKSLEDVKNAIHL